MTFRSAVAGSGQAELFEDSAQTAESAVEEEVGAESQGLPGLTDVLGLLPKVLVPFEPAPMSVTSVEVEVEQGCGRVVGQAQDPKLA